MKKLAIITTHPIQYNAPFFRMLYERKNIEPKIFYTWSQSASGVIYDPGFKQEVAWDIPLTEGYPFVFSENIAAKPGSHHAKGIDNPSLIKEIEDWNADAVLVYGWNFKSHLRVMKYFHHKIPVLFRGDSTLLDEQPGLKKILRRIYLRHIFSFADKALYAGKANRNYFSAHGMKENELVFMPHAIDNKRFSRASENEERAKALREKLNIPQDATVFLFAGKLEEKKQPFMLAEMFASVRQDNTYLIIAGSGEQQEKITADYQQHPNIRIIGFQNQQQMPVLYHACDVFVLPSKGPGETWGLSINEAMAAGKAVITTDGCGASYDLVQPGVNGYVFKKNDGSALKEYLLNFMNNNDFVKAAGKRSEVIISSYSFQRDCEAVESVMINKQLT